MKIKNYLSDLIVQKKALANNLIDMGVEADESELLNTLVPKVLEIPVGSIDDNEIIVNYIYRDRITGEEKVAEQILRKGANSILPDDVGDVEATENNPKLIFEGWNYADTDLTNLQHDLDIGGMYITVDGKSYFLLRVNQLTGFTLSFQFTKTGTGTIYIDWGDDTPITTSGSHTYSGNGMYWVKVWMEGDGNMTFGSAASIIGSGSVTRLMLISCFFGADVIGLTNNVFENCRNLRTISIPKNVITLGTASNSFKSCNSLKYLTIPILVERLGSSFLNEATSLINVSIPKNARVTETNNFYQCYSLKSLIFPQLTTAVGTNAFKYCYNLQRVYLSENITSIVSFAFENCHLLKKMNIPKGLTTVSDSAFKSCSSLIIENLDLEEITSIGISAFEQGRFIQNISLPKNISIIPQSAFNGCYSITMITVPENITGIGQTSFAYCFNLSEVIIEHGLITMGNGAFQNCYGLQKITIPDSVTTIGSSCFNGCHKLQKIIIPDSVTTIGSSCFTNCGSLKEITFSSNLIALESNMFNSSWGLTKLIFKSVLPPTMPSASIFTNTNSALEIFVPNSSVDFYKTATNWVASANKIFPMSEYREEL